MPLRHLFQPGRVRWLGAIGATLLAFYPSPTVAQIAGDGTLGTQVNGNLTAPCTGTCIITNGATRGSNLFHSFQQFSLPNNDFAGFVTTPAIQNVIVRVTGVGQPFISNINGTIATSNPANFFLLNPNGIIFGPGATLNIGGSFLATTASRMQFADGTEFRTNDPAPLLTVSVPTGLQFGQAPGSIQMQGVRLSAGNTDSFSDFALVGGNITLDNAIVEAPGRRVELGGVATGIVGLRVNGNNLNLDLPNDVERADISLLNGSLVRVDADGGGTIAINSRNLNLSGRSLLVSGISQEGSEPGNRQAGDIVVNATGTVTAEAGSRIANAVFQGRTGNSGNIQIQAQSLSFSSSAILLATTFGNGNAGNITINAQEGVSFDDKSANGGFQSGVYNTVEETGRGKAGNIEINAGSLSLTRGAQLDSSVFGRGDGGNIIIHARQSVVFDGVSPDGFQSAAFSEILETGQGRSGTIQITANSLAVTNGAQLNTGTRNQGDAGNITIDVRGKALFSGNSTVRTAVKEGAIGNGGDIQITAGSVEISNGGELLTFTAGQGRGGSVTINARDEVVVDGQSAGDSFVGIASNLLPGGKGRGGDISVFAGSLILKNGATFQTATDGQGNAGAIVINARDNVLVTGERADSNSGLLTVVKEDGQGQGGRIQITANSVLLTDNGGLVSTTLGQGDAGSINIDARNTVLFDHGFALSNTQSLTGGNANNINISTDLFSVTNQSILSTNTFGEGNAGDVLISANRLVGE